MGNRVSAPRLDEHTATIMSQYNIKPHHVDRLYRIFTEFDENHTGQWTILEFNHFLHNYPESVISPSLEALVKLASSSRDGRLTFLDFVVSVCSYCALNKEELLQYNYIMIDSDRSGILEKAELHNFFAASVKLRKRKRMYARQAIYPPNYTLALDQFEHGNWKSLVFEEFCLMCDLFPHLAFPSVHLQNLLRRAVLGTSFWDDWDEERLRIFHLEAESKTMSFTGINLLTGEEVTIVKPGRVTMKEIFEFTKRNGLRQVDTEGEGFAQAARPDREEGTATSFTKARDAVLSRAPLLNLIRNPNSVYHVPLDRKDGARHLKKGTILGALDKDTANYR